ncbi:MAG: PilX N-terminal domain-containing pilus assembly protein [Azonexus sp.]
MKKLPSSRPTIRKQQGIILVTATMFLIAITIVIISLMRTGILEERMVANSRDWQNAFQAAEAGLRDAEREVISRTRISGQTGFVTGCSSNGLCLPNTCTSSTDCTPIWVALSGSDTGWKTGSGTTKSVGYGAFTSAPALPGLGAQPRYIVEAVSVPIISPKVDPNSPKSNTLYRVTAVGFGANTSSRVMLQAMINPAD